MDEGNLYYADYNGALYNRDLTFLYHVPSHQREVKLADTLETLGSYSFWYTSAKYIVIPWGTKVAEENALDYLRRDIDYYEATYGSTVSDFPYIIIPDTLRTIGKLSKYPLVHFIYSDNYKDIPLAKLYPEQSAFHIESVVPKWKKEFILELGKESFHEFYGITPSSFKTFGKRTYYFDENCKMVTGVKTIGNQTYTFLDNGILQSDKTVEANGRFATESGKIYYYIDGVKSTGLHYIDGKAYYFNGSGVMQHSKWQYAEGNWYYLNTYGAGMVKYWALSGNKWYYLKEDGKMAKSQWIEWYGKWYYVGADGAMYVNRSTPDGRYVDGSGVRIR